jgi:acyl-coenzyme A synthetase/AMP-(fatty) acid ligase
MSQLPLFAGEDSRPIAWRDGHVVSLGEFRRDVAAIASDLPETNALINLCEDRYAFLAAYAAALASGRTSLLPSSRVEQVVLEVERANPGSIRIDDAGVERSLRRRGQLTLPGSLPDDFIAMIGYTSGSTGQPKPNAKRWRAIHGTNACNVAAMRKTLGLSSVDPAWILATVPPQHMYGMELSVLVPLIGNMAVHSGRPLFPADIASALEQLPMPRVLVSTPVHLRAIVESAQSFPEVALVVSATAPLNRALAHAVEDKLRGPLLEMFGSTETCVFATRRTSVEDAWHAYEGISLVPMEETTRVEAAWFAESVVLQDVVELAGPGRFIVRGRHSDMIEVAGKRASLSDLTRRVLAIEGVRDAAVFQPEATGSGGIVRVAALVVAPTRTAREILDALAASVDSAFLPRPLVLVDALPRNELGKLPRDALMALLKGARRG